MNLRDNVYWHDGAIFSADDVIFTFRLLKKKEIGYPYLSDIEPIKDIQKIKSLKIKIIYEEPFAPALTYLTFKILPCHLLKDYLDIPENFKASNFNFSPVGTGPYKLVKIIPYQKIILEHFEHYFLGKPNIRKYIAELNTDALINPLKLIKEEVDLAEIEPELLDSFLKNRDFRKKIKIFTYRKNSFTYLGFNLNYPAFKSKRIRQALALGLNKKAIVQSILRGRGEICFSPISLNFWKNSKIKKYFYNPQYAKMLLREEGFEDKDKNGYLEKNGRNFEITILTNSESLLRRNIALLTKQNWENLGIKVKFEFLEYSIFLERLMKKNFQCIISGFLLDLDPNQYDIWHSLGQLNYFNYSNPFVDRLLELGKITINKLERKKIYDKLQEIIVSDLPVIFLISPKYIIGVNKRIKINKYPNIIGSTNSFSSFLFYWKIEQ
ncbi:ABC transporter substrate-binding protein [Candidatus Aminicenantes bacterium AC-335-A11]|nr:ABC transporter substrate-binding protein [Candidatus Aminicenantes bacterium AC-335-A11]